MATLPGALDAQRAVLCVEGSAEHGFRGLAQAFIQPDRANASQALRHVADQLRPKWPKLRAFIDDSEADVLAHMDFPSQLRTEIHSRTGGLGEVTGCSRDRGLLTAREQLRRQSLDTRNTIWSILQIEGLKPPKLTSPALAHPA